MEISHCALQQTDIQPPVIWPHRGVDVRKEEFGGLPAQNLPSRRQPQPPDIGVGLQEVLVLSFTLRLPYLHRPKRRHHALMIIPEHTSRAQRKLTTVRRTDQGPFPNTPAARQTSSKSSHPCVPTTPAGAGGAAVGDTWPVRQHATRPKWRKQRHGLGPEAIGADAIYANERCRQRKPPWPSCTPSFQNHNPAASYGCPL